MKSFNIAIEVFWRLMSVVIILWVCANYTTLEEDKITWWIVSATGIYYGMIPYFEWFKELFKNETKQRNNR